MNEEPSRVGMSSELYSERFHPLEGLSRCEDVLNFLCECVSLRSTANLELSEDATTGLAWVLNLTASAMANISCEHVLHFLRECVATPRLAGNFELSEEATTGFIWILNCITTAMAEIGRDVDRILKEKRENL